MWSLISCSDQLCPASSAEPHHYFSALMIGSLFRVPLVKAATSSLFSLCFRSRKRQPTSSPSPALHNSKWLLIAGSAGLFVVLLRGSLRHRSRWLIKTRELLFLSRPLTQARGRVGEGVPKSNLCCYPSLMPFMRACEEREAALPSGKASILSWMSAAMAASSTSRSLAETRP